MATDASQTGIGVYTPFVLQFVYDFIVVKISLSFAWRCSATKLENLYSRLIRAADIKAKARPLNILDVGVGTGYFLEHAPLPTDCSVSLADLNPDCLQCAATRVAKTHPSAKVKCVQADFLSDSGIFSMSPERFGSNGFDLISCSLLLHCVPGSAVRKAEALARLKKLLRPDGVLCGATVLGDGANHNWFGKCIMWYYNLSGVFSNRTDSEMAFVHELEKAFQSVHWKVVGTVFVFEASSPTEA